MLARRGYCRIGQRRDDNIQKWLLRKIAVFGVIISFFQIVNPRGDGDVTFQMRPFARFAAKVRQAVHGQIDFGGAAPVFEAFELPYESIVQMLLGNLGRAGGGVNALRGESNVQGSTDHGIHFHILTGYLAPSSGTARIAGIDVAEDRLHAAEHLGYLPENGPLYPEMTPRELLQFFGEARGVTGARFAERLDYVVAECALSEVLDKPKRLRDLGFRGEIEMDGGIDPDTIGACAAAGANVFVAGTAVFGHDDVAGRIRSLRQAAEAAV